MKKTPYERIATIVGKHCPYRKGTKGYNDIQLKAEEDIVSALSYHNDIITREINKHYICKKRLD